MPSPATFDRIAPFYDILARLVFGASLTTAQRWAVAQGLPPDTSRILFVGGGTGALLPALLHQCPHATVVYVEASAAMLTRARATLRRQAPAALERVYFHHGPHDSLPAQTAPFDAVLTFFFLDLFPDEHLPTVLQQLQAHTHAATTWLIADFLPPRTPWQRWLLRTMYAFFQLTTNLRNQTLPNWPAQLATIGLRLTDRASFARGCVQAGIWRQAT